MIKSESLPVWIVDQVKTCVKRPLKYTLIHDKRYKSWGAFKRNVLSKPLTLVHYDVFSEALKQLKGTGIVTQLPGDPEPEQVFVPPPDHVLVVGALGEVYHADLERKFECVGKADTCVYVPRHEVRRCLEVTPRVYAVLRNTHGFEIEKGVMRMTTSWGAKHIVLPGDFLMMTNNGLPDYRVQRMAFRKTYLLKAR